MHTALFLSDCRNNSCKLHVWSHVTNVTLCSLLMAGTMPVGAHCNAHLQVGAVQLAGGLQLHHLRQDSPLACTLLRPIRADPHQARRPCRTGPISSRGLASDNKPHDEEALKDNVEALKDNIEVLKDKKTPQQVMCTAKQTYMLASMELYANSHYPSGASRAPAVDQNQTC